MQTIYALGTLLILGGLLYYNLKAGQSIYDWYKEKIKIRNWRIAFNLIGGVLIAYYIYAFISG